MSTENEIFVSVDVETAGPIPEHYSLLSIGACDVYNEASSFSCDMKPVNRNAVPKALEVTGFSLAALEQSGTAPFDAMRRFDEWARSLTLNGGTLVFVGLNAGFDWSFVNYYFHKYLGDNPFGFAPLDIKAYYMGLTGCAWSDTKSSRLAKDLKPVSTSNHKALDDARYQAELFRLMRSRSGRRP